MRKDMRLLVITFFSLGLVLLVYSLWTLPFSGKGPKGETAVSTSEVASSSESTPPAEEPTFPKANQLRLRSVGDLLIHDRVSAMALKEDGSYDFSDMLSVIKPYTQHADITVANLEVITAYPQYPVSGYPSFNAPKSLLPTLKDIGIDIVSNATNHTLDLDVNGAYASIENLKEAGLPYSGSFESQADKAQPRILEANGIKLGFLSYTYGTNGVPIPYGEEYVVNLVDTDKMLADVEWLKPQVDAVVVTLQLGPEYDPIPNAEQEYVFNLLSEAGVSLILGGHPHVLQPVDWINGDKTFAIYSQASFLSGQVEEENKQGGITEVTFVKDDAGKVSVTNPKFMPIHILGFENQSLYQTVPFADYNKYSIPNGATWWETLKERMTSRTNKVEIVTHLETATSAEDTDVFQ